MDLIRIAGNDDFVVDYDKDRGMYRVAIRIPDYYENYYNKEIWFDAYEEKELPKTNHFIIEVENNV